MCRRQVPRQHHRMTSFDIAVRRCTADSSRKRFRTAKSGIRVAHNLTPAPYARIYVLKEELCHSRFATSFPHARGC